MATYSVFERRYGKCSCLLFVCIDFSAPGPAPGILDLEEKKGDSWSGSSAASAQRIYLLSALCFYQSPITEQTDA